MEEIKYLRVELMIDNKFEWIDIPLFHYEEIVDYSENDLLDFIADCFVFGEDTNYENEVKIEIVNKSIITEKLK